MSFQCESTKQSWLRGALRVVAPAAVALGALVAVAVMVAGCASTTMQSTWRDPGYTGGPFRKVFVLGQAARDVTARRVLEDVLVTRMQAGGADAVPAWRHLPGDRQADEATFAAAVAASGAEALLMVRLLGIDTQTRRLVWSGTSETFNPTSVQRDAPGFADLIVSTLQKSGLLPAVK
jgi:F0F1-type ATP synthase membrane subunit c/vacuolar-type H+-ATPase subunit K